MDEYEAVAVDWQVWQCLPNVSIRRAQRPLEKPKDLLILRRCGRMPCASGHGNVVSHRAVVRRKRKHEERAPKQEPNLAART